MTRPQQRGFRVTPAVFFTSLVLLTAVSTPAEKRAAHTFSFGTTRPDSSFTIVPPHAHDRTAVGFGFEPGGRITAHQDYATSEGPFFFSVSLPEGNYRVRITLGGSPAGSVTTVKAEARRLMLENVRAAPGEIVTRDIVVNLRTPRIDGDRTVRLKPRERAEEWISWDENLTLEFSGQRPCLRTLEIIPAPEVPTVYLAGDSTVADQALEPWNSWGQMLPRFFRPGVAVANHAESGESIRSSLSAGRFEKVFGLLKPGDWLILQFGHNDMKDQRPDALDTYRENLTRIITRARARGATPVLVTSMERKAGVRSPTLAGYPDTVREVARKEGAALVDLNAMSLELYRALGANLDQAFQDGTHHNNYGSYLLATCVAVGIAEAELDLADFLVDDVRSFVPALPEPLETFAVPPSPRRSPPKPEGS